MGQGVCFLNESGVGHGVCFPTCPMDSKCQAALTFSWHKLKKFTSLVISSSITLGLISASSITQCFFLCLIFDVHQEGSYSFAPLGSCFQGFCHCGFLMLDSGWHPNIINIWWLSNFCYSLMPFWPPFIFTIMHFSYCQSIYVFMLQAQLWSWKWHESSSTDSSTYPPELA